MSEISNNALSREAWRRYQEQYEAIDWERDQDTEKSSGVSNLETDPLKLLAF